jgi:hypothetical protein
MKKSSYIKNIQTFVSKHSTWFAAGSFFLLATLMTWPFVVDPLHTMTAPIGGDVGNSVIKFEAIKREGLNPFVNGELHSLAQPDSVRTNVGVDRVSFFSTIFLWFSTLLTNSITAHSLMTFTGYFLTALVAFLFVKTVTKSSLIGFIAGCVYGFFPLMIGLARAAPTYTHMWLYILPIWAFWLIGTQGLTMKRLMLAIMSILPGLFWTPYYSFHVLLIGACCLAVILLLMLGQWGYRKALLVTIACLGLWATFAIAYRFIGISSEFSAVPTRTIQEAYDQSSHPLMYMLPGEFTLWGEKLNALLVAKIPRSFQTSLYLGITTLILAAISVYFLVRNKITQKNIRIAVWLALAISAATFLFSLAPTINILGVDVPTPNYLVVTVVPALRAGQRLAMPLMGSVTILACIGLYLLVKRLAPRTRFLSLVLAFAIICFDISSLSPDTPTVLKQQQSLTTLSQQPPARTAQYYASSLVGNPQQNVCLPQIQHGMPLVNDCAMGRDFRTPDRLDIPSPTLRAIVDLPLCQQPTRLRELNIRYVIISNNDWYIKNCLENTHSGLMVRDDVYSVYRL